MQLKYLCNFTKHWLQAPWGCHDSVETCRIVILCELIVRLLVIIQNTKRCTVNVLNNCYSIILFIIIIIIIIII